MEKGMKKQFSVPMLLHYRAIVTLEAETAPEAEDKAIRFEAIVDSGIAGAELYDWERTGPAKEDR